jgi:hypothetical protein
MLIATPALDYQPWTVSRGVRGQFVQDSAEGIISHNDNLQRRVFSKKRVRRPSDELGEIVQKRGLDAIFEGNILLRETNIGEQS